MKKLLLTFICLLAAATISATECTVKNDDKTDTGVWYDGTATIMQVIWSGSTNVADFTPPRIYKGHALVFDAGEGNYWTEFEYTVDGSYYGNNVKFGSSDSEISVKNYTSATAGTGTPVSKSGGSATLTFTAGRYAFVYNSATQSNVQLRITSFTATYVKAEDNRTETSLSWSKEKFTYNCDSDENEPFPVLTTTPADLTGVAYSSSDESVATINETGAIIVKKPGVTTIKATFGGNTSYQPAAPASYELTVVKSGYYNFVGWGFLGENSNWTTSYEKRIIEFDDAFVTFEGAGKQTGTSSVTDCPVTKGSAVVVSLKGGNKEISAVSAIFKQWGTKAQTVTLHTSADGVTFTETSNKTSDFKFESVSVPAGTKAIKFTFSSTSNQVGIAEINLDLVNVTNYSVTFDENKMVTFSAPKAVDFSEVEGVKAYIASAVGEGYVTMTAVEDGVIAANTGLLLVADAEGSVKIPVSDNTGASYTTSNLLWDWAAGAEIDASDEGDHEGYHAYVLGKVDGDFGFVYITKSHTNTSVNGRAYLLLEETFHGDSGSKKPKRIVFGGEQTGVESVAVAPEVKAEGIYNILGQPVDENYRGFVIRNGVKMYNR